MRFRVLLVLVALMALRPCDCLRAQPAADCVINAPRSCQDMWGDRANYMTVADSCSDYDCENDQCVVTGGDEFYDIYVPIAESEWTSLSTQTVPSANRTIGKKPAGNKINSKNCFMATFCVTTCQVVPEFPSGPKICKSTFQDYYGLWFLDGLTENCDQIIPP